MRFAAVALPIYTALVGGCVLFTGSTGGYTGLDSGRVESSCTSAAECGAAEVCCLVITSLTTSIAGTCLASCTTSLPQLCTTSAECEDGGVCSVHTCTIDGGGGMSFPLQACGEIQDCTP